MTCIYALEWGYGVVGVCWVGWRINGAFLRAQKSHKLYKLSFFPIFLRPSSLLSLFRFCCISMGITPSVGSLLISFYSYGKSEFLSRDRAEMRLPCFPRTIY